MNTYSTGQKFTDGCDQFILAQVIKNMVTLINLSTGNRWINPLKVRDTLIITRKEMKKITNNCTFRLIE